MIGLFILYFIGKSFNDLAFEFEKKRWVYIVLGIASYYAGTFTFSILLGIVLGLGAFEPVEIHPYLSGLMVLPFGLLSCYLYYRYLKNQWSRQPGITDSELLDEDFLDSE